MTTHKTKQSKKFDFYTEWEAFMQGMAEIRKTQKETSKQIKETDKQMKETDKRIRENEEKLSRMGIRLGNIQNNMGDDAEEMFYQYLSEKMELGGIQFDNLFKNARDSKGNEYDMILQNGSYSALIEVKYKAHANDLKKIIQKQLPHFIKGPGKNKKILVGLATPVATDTVRERAKELGMFLLTQNGSNVKLENDASFKPRVY